MQKLQIVILLFAVVVFSTACKKDNKSMVVGEIKKASDLATTQFTIDKLVYGVKEKSLFWVVNLSKSRFLAKSKAFVKTGIDLNEIKEDDITITDDRITLKLPHVRVITFSYPAYSFQEINKFSVGFPLNKISVAEKEQLFRDAELDIRQSLQYMNIIETTENKTRTLFEILLKNLGYNEVFIEFEKGELIPVTNTNLVK